MSSQGSREYVNRTVPHAYLDEIFHAPQAARYCDGDYKTYDPKLTTPPGLYTLSLLLYRILPGWLTGHSTCTDVSFLRGTNLVLLLLLPHLLHSFRAQIMKDKSQLPPAYTRHAMLDEAATRAPLEITPGAVGVSSEQEPDRRRPASHGAVPRPAPAQHPRGGWSGKLTLQEVLEASRLSEWLYTLSTWRVYEGHVIAFLPPLWFFGFLYYTDIGGVCFVLASSRAALSSRHVLAAWLGFVSLLFRQTNVIWLMFIMATSLLRLAQVDSDVGHSMSQTFYSLLRLVGGPGRQLALRIVAPYIPIFMLFVAFLLWNDLSIVLGDKSNHIATLHFAQLSYFLGFSLFFGWPAMLSQAGGPIALVHQTLRTLAGNARQVLITVILCGLTTAAIKYGTLAHPFLLADNRHYSFYVWRRIINRTRWSRYALVPFYVVSARCWIDALSRTQSDLWILGLCASTALTLIPSPLIEPRYFLVPYLLMRLHIPSGPPRSSQTQCRSACPREGGGEEREIREAPRARDEESRPVWGLLLEFAWYAVLNILTMYLFLHRPFKWPSEKGWQRFMW
ncbi:Alpha-1,2 glucosyltransferase/transcriptional activator [Ceraceosorus bombacis]|uniref:Dol-P-Glc:Glc(2)Man(9)GlcNAc(2)-PP-Dol alpha-1,2-glucosyltransferase n=1 Tax=Ceraceosorus bombacis TaxID=401625 RepID=A0A0P1BLX8_9BASI|nr:Alpha-1,2 glucosyltransferase/transcriptional activator [Ceraceosorus bombacis]